MPPPTSPRACPSNGAAGPEHRSAPARILDAAMGRFAERGVAGTSLKVIAEDAGVSQGLIVHHFGSKEALREACDAAVLGTIRHQMRVAAAEGAQLDVLEAFRRRQGHHPAFLPYLARALAEGGPSAVELVDELAAETVRAVGENVANGSYVPTEHPRERALVLLIWSLGAVTLHDHVRRLLGADLTGEPEALLPYLRGATEIMANGLFTEAMRESVHGAIVQLEREG